MHRVRLAVVSAVLALLGCSTSPDAQTPRSPSAAGAPSAAPAAPKLSPETRDFDQEHLALDLDLDMDRGTVTGTATHTLTALADLSQVRMHLVDMKVESIVSDGGGTCSSTQAGDVLTIALDRPRTKGERFTLTISYGGAPKSGLWFFKPTPEHPEVPLQVWSQGEGEENRHWIPCYDLPDDRFTSSLRVTVPAGLQTLSNGSQTKTEPLADGRVAHTWTLERPHVSYLITLVVGTFDEVKRDAAGVEQRDLVPPGWGKWCDEIFGRTPDMMAFFQEYTGERYPWPAYSQVTVWDFSWGGMENTGATTLNMRALHKAGVRPDYAADGLVAHELAHQWFGDLITCRTFNHMWLNEGFANYFTDMWDERHKGADDFAVDCLGQREGYMNGVDLKATSEAPRPKKPTDCGDMEKHPYVKGSSVLHMLRKLLGDDVFKQGIRRYVRDNKDKSVESEALRAALEAESIQDLKWFFDQWVYSSGFPELAVAYYPEPAARQIRVLVRQTQPVTETMPVFRVPISVMVVDGMGPQIVGVEMDRTAVEFTIPMRTDEPPSQIVFDPDNYLLARVRETKPRALWQAQLASGATNAARLLAARALADFGPDGVAALAKAASSDADYSVRAEACTALGKIKDSPEAAAGLCAAAEDKDSRVRRAAMNAMANCKPLFVGDALRKRLADDPSVYVAADAGWALGKCKADKAFEALVEGLKRESHRDQIRQRIMDGLKDLGDPRGAEVAMRHLDYSWGKGIQHQLRKSALDAMVALAPDAPATREWIAKLLTDPYFRMKQWAAEAAAKLKMTDALPVLDDVAANGIGPGVQRAAKAAAEKLRAAPSE
jgi:aminopeptidase N